MTSEEIVRAYFDAYEGKPELFDKVVSPDYIDYGHTPPGHGPQGGLALARALGMRSIHFVDPVAGIAELEEALQ